MAQTSLHARSTGLVAAVCLLVAAPALAADDASARDLTPTEIAGAMVRQDSIRGVYEVIEAPGLNTLFVASTPSFDDGTPGYVDLLDPSDLGEVRRIELARRAFALAMDHKRGKLFVGNTLDGSLSVLDAKSGQLLDTIQLGRKQGEWFEHTRMIEVDEESGRVFVTSPSETGTLWIVDAGKENTVQRIDSVGLWAAGLAHDAASGRIYVGGGGMAEIQVIDALSGERVGSLRTGDTIAEGKDASKHFFVNLSLADDGRRLFAADATSGQLYVFDTATGAIVKTVPIGPGTLDVTYVQARDLIFVTYRGTDKENPKGTGGIAVLDGSDYSSLASIPLAAHPNSLAIGDLGRALYVTVKAPMDKDHPDYREGATDSIVRIDLQKLASALR